MSGLRLVLAATGASGSIHARHVLRQVVAAERVAEIHFMASAAALRVAHEELDTRARDAAGLADEWLTGVERHAAVTIHDIRDVGAGPASGSFRHDGMAILPCSTATAAHVAHGTTSNLVHRAAECTLKERRRLLVMVRESPLSVIHLDNLLTLARAGATIIPLAPPWYHRPRTLEDLVAHGCARILDHLGLPELVSARWSGSAPPREDE